MSPRTRRRLSVAAIALTVLVVVFVAGVALFVERPSTTVAADTVTTASKPATPTASFVPTIAPVPPTGGYALDFTLPTFGKSGCMVCHGDPQLTIVRGDQSHNYWIDQKIVDASAHAKIQCTGCHIDFAYTSPHKDAADWRRVAKESCKNCHPDQFRDYSLGSHSEKVGPGHTPDPKAANKPLCGDCHGSHAMPKLKNNPAGKAAEHALSQQMCGSPGCHADYWANYNDYYHGAAYKRGATDAPACWGCHETHATRNHKDSLAYTNDSQLASTCGRCHEDVGEGYLTYTKLIHSKQQTLDGNPVYSTVKSARTGMSGLGETIGSLFGGRGGK